MEYVSLLDIVTTTESSLRSPVSLEESIDRDTIFYTTSILYEKDHDSSIEDYLSFEEMDHSYLYYSNDTLYNYLEELNQEHSYKGFWSSSLYTYEHDQPFSLYKTRLEYLGDDSYSAELLEEKANELSAHTVDDLSYIIPNEPEYIRLNELVHREEEICTQKSGQKIFYEILTCITEQRDYVHLQDFTVQSFLSYNTLIDYNNFMYYYGERLSEYSVSHPEEYYLFMEEYLGGKSEVPFNQEYSFFCEMNPTCMV